VVLRVIGAILSLRALRLQVIGAVLSLRALRLQVIGAVLSLRALRLASHWSKVFGRCVFTSLEQF